MKQHYTLWTAWRASSTSLGPLNLRMIRAFRSGNCKKRVHDEYNWFMTSCSSRLEIKVCTRGKWPIRPELIPVSEAWNYWEYFYSPLHWMLVHRRVTHLYAWVETDTVRVKRSCPGLEPRPLAPETSALTMRPPRLSQCVFRI